jgi:membrane associated rhomboid family serine protease
MRNKELAKQLFRVSFFPICFLAICWAIFFVDEHFNLNLSQFGTAPRTAKGLLGILFSPFLHGGLDHIASNSVPILILGMMMFYFYKRIAWPVFIWIYLISGIWLWIGGRNSEFNPTVHIGASGLIYGAATFLFFSGVFRKHKPLMVVSVLVIFLYGSMMWGIFPLMPGISWEAHLFGAIAGVLVAYNYKKDGPQRELYRWETEDDGVDFEAEEKRLEEEAQKQREEYQKFLEQNNINIHYHFKPKDKEEGDAR